MYRRRRPNPVTRLLSLIFVGILAGVAYLIYDNFRNQPSSAPVPTSLPLSTPTPAATLIPLASALAPTLSASPVEGASLFIPTAGILVPIIEVYLDGESWDIRQLGMNAGHLQGTAWLDDSPGNIVLSGHVEMADGRAGIFATIKDLKAGDLAILRQQNTEHRYSVKEVKRVAPDELTPLYPTSTDQLTLLTCGNYDFLQDAYLERVVVIAERIR